MKHRALHGLHGLASIMVVFMHDLVKASCYSEGYQGNDNTIRMIALSGTAVRNTAIPG